MHKICFTISFISCLYMFRAHVPIIRRSELHFTASGIITPIETNFVYSEFCVSGWLNTEINILRCTVSKTSKLVHLVGFIIRIYRKLLWPSSFHEHFLTFYLLPVFISLVISPWNAAVFEALFVPLSVLVSVSWIPCVHWVNACVTKFVLITSCTFIQL